jgi:thiol-disulfide isomerase/thioredoxin
MKKTFLILIIALGLCNTGSAQTPVNNNTSRSITTRRPTPLDENTIVKDSAGNVLPYKTWLALASTGKWGIKTSNVSRDVFTLFRLSAEEQQRNKAARESIKTTGMLPPTTNGSAREITAAKTIEVNARYTPEAAPTFDESTIVKDSAGTVLNYKDWKTLTETGNYSLRSNEYTAEDQGKPRTYTLIKMSQQQKEAMYSRMPPPRESGFFKNGEKIDPIKVTDMNGKSINMKKLVGKVIVVNFWFIACPPCRQEIPELNKIAAQYAKNPDVIFVAIALDKRYELKKFLEENPYNYQIVDDGRYYTTGYGVNLFPTNVVVDKAGVVRFNSSGFGYTTPYWIKKTIDESLAAN